MNVDTHQSKLQSECTAFLREMYRIMLIRVNCSLKVSIVPHQDKLRCVSILFTWIFFISRRPVISADARASKPRRQSLVDGRYIFKGTSPWDRILSGTHTHKHLNDVRHHNAHNELEVLDVQESIELRKRVIRSPLESSFFRGALRPQKP